MPANKTGPSGKKKKGRRARLLVITVVLLLVAGIGFGAYWSVSTVRASFPETSGTLQLKGLGGQVKVARDDHGIPQIYADSAEDLFRAQGFVQAQDRFWEMDVRRHLTAGRLSEMFGDGQVETDAFIRTMGWRKVAQEEYDTKLSATTKKYLQAYSDGVNAYLKDHQGKSLSVEYAALEFENEYKPEKWTPVDSVAWLKAMAWDLRGNLQSEIDRSLASTRLSPQQIEQLYPAYPYGRNKPVVEGGAVDPATKEFDPKATPTEGQTGQPGQTGQTGQNGRNGQPGGTGTAGTPGANGTPGTQNNNGTPATGGGAGAAGGLRSGLTALSGTLDKIPALLGPSGNGIGSNSWVVSGQYTTTGKPLLANDPHLAPQLPSLWYQMGLHCTKTSAACPFDVAGYTFAGMPGVVIGHNQDIAWGMTNLGADVTDLYLEKVTSDSYLYDNKQVPFATRKETIKVAGGSDRTITVRSTRNGPVVSDRNSELGKVGQDAPVKDPAPDRAEGYAVALRWTALDAGRTMDALMDLNRATDFASFRKAAAGFEVPSQNLIYADTKGNFGYQAPGRIPVRKGDGRMPAPGWDPAYQWTGFLKPEELPWELNPKRGYIVTANQAVIDNKKYPYALTGDWGYGARSQRINDLIQSKIKDGGKISTDDMQKMQMDNSSEIAKLLTPYLLKINIKAENERETKYVREAQKLLQGWDYTQEADSAAAAYFNAVWRNTLKLAFGNKLPKELRVKGQCLRVRPANDAGPQEDLDGNTRLVRECGEREPDSAQPDGGDRWFEVVRGILDKPNDDWWKTGGRAGAGNRDELLARAMKDARWELTSKLGKDVDSWSWGRLHQLNLKNQTLGKEGPGIVRWMLNRGPWNLAGGEAAVNAAGWNAAGGYDVIWVPSMRMVVNLADLDKSRWINLTGASGHAYNAHYYDQTDKWAKGELLPWAFSADAVKKGTDAELTLKP
ncbi:penicillin acylase family protein [Streptomyces telluris]|uniref:Penicillin acylase family protein n=1 Tax=Streptomyces telluris TaxID=2720021 RepID=A0A9X2RR08_9ACTN|nr:penicillin acylase family protein [Streptomyces telluris]MCQ8773011.1 penicillin acylase family protein [Streptomyces telluris]NJP79656.1 penicillin acylase family protein [Streptomyces telluris]